MNIIQVIKIRVTFNNRSSNHKPTYSNQPSGNDEPLHNFGLLEVTIQITRAKEGTQKKLPYVTLPKQRQKKIKDPGDLEKIE